MTRNFRNLERFEDEDDCYFQYRKEKQARKSKLVPKMIDQLAWLSCGYGVRPSHTVLLSLALIILFTGIFWSGHALQPAAAAHGVASISINDAFYFSSMEFLGRSPQNIGIVEGFEFLTVIETLAGWLLMALFLVTMSKVMLR